MEMLLKEKKVWSAIKDEAPNPITTAWTTNDEIAFSTIGLNIEDSQIQHIRNCESAKKAWTALKDIHENASQGNRVRILRQIMKERLNEGEDAEAHVNRMNELFQKLMALGSDLKPEFFMCGTLLATLPSSYDGLVTALESLSDDKLTSDVVRSKIIEEYKRRQERDGNNSDATALKVYDKRDSYKFHCFFCKEDGHIKRNCQKFKRMLNTKNNRQSANLVDRNDMPGSSDEILFVFGSFEDWVVDSGATCHVCCSKEKFISFDDMHRENISVANGQEVTANGKGTIQFEMMNGQGYKTTVKMHDVLYVPSLKGNLISVKRLTEKGFKLIFSANVCEIWNADGTRQIGIADAINNLYKLREPKAVNLLTSCQKNCVHRWHEILGHRDIEVIKTLPDCSLVDGMEIIQCDCAKTCEVCLKGKMTRLKFPNKSENRAKSVLDLVHSDVCGPMQTATPSGKRYVLTFVDDYSRFTVIYLLRHKSEVNQRFKEYFELTNGIFGKRVKMVRSDRGTEYVNEALELFMRNNGIQIQRTAPYTPQQNGVAERKNRTLMEMTRCMLLGAELPKKFWGEAITMANFIQNRVIWKSVSKTPHELWFGRKPVYSNLKAFGDKCYIHVPDEKRRKLDAKAVEGILVGYDTESKAYRCFNPGTDKVIVSRDVKFVEVGSNVIRCRPLKEKSNLQISNASHITPIDNMTINEGSNEVSYDDDVVTHHEIVETDNLVVTDHNHVGVDNIHGDNNDVQNEPLITTNVRVSSRNNKGQAARRLIEEIDVVVNDLKEPSSYQEAVTHPNKDFWIDAMQEEIDSLTENKTWELVQLPDDRTPIGCKWVYKIKQDSSGEIVKFKARLVAQGFSQKYGTDYDEVFAPVARPVTMRILFSIAWSKSMKVVHLDAKTAFLNGELNEEIYMKQPPGFVNNECEDHVCFLKKSIYGLKQSARSWNKSINCTLIQTGLTQSKNDQCLYTKFDGNEMLYVLLYVDDILLFSTSDVMLSHFEEALSNVYTMQNLGPVKMYLGINIKMNSDGSYTMNQSSYIRKLLTEVNLTNAKHADIPISIGYGKSESELLPNNDVYRKTIGSLLYISVNTRPDISAAVSILAQKVANPTQEDWSEVKHTLKYLKATIDLELRLGCLWDENELYGYADADWAGNSQSRKSNTGYIIKLGNGSVSWTCKRQSCVALSSTEAEFVSLSETCKEVLWIRRVMEDIGWNFTRPTQLFEDNQSCLKMIQDEKFSNRSKHISTREYFVKDYVDKGEIRCSYCPTLEMIADIMTKPLSRDRFQELRSHTGLRCPNEEEC